MYLAKGKAGAVRPYKHGTYPKFVLVWLLKRVLKVRRYIKVDIELKFY
jgi:hypothetical protein